MQAVKENEVLYRTNVTLVKRNHHIVTIVGERTLPIPKRERAFEFRDAEKEMGSSEGDSRS